MTNFITYIQFFRNFANIVAKCLSICACLYFILKADEYVVKWNMLTWLFPTFTISLNNLISFFNVYILLIPLSIILVSFIITDSRTLNILSSFFGIFGALFGFLRGIYNDTMGQIYDFKIVMVTHIATYEKKKEIFLLEFNRVSESISAGVKAKLDFLNSYLTPHDFLIYDVKLNKLVTLEEVKKYAFEVVTELSSNYNTIKKPNPFNILDYVSFKTLFIGCSVAIVLGFAVALFFTNTAEHAPVIQQNAENAREAARINYENSIQTAQAFDQINADLEKVVITTSEALANTANKLQDHEKRLSKHDDMFQGTNTALFMLYKLIEGNKNATENEFSQAVLQFALDN